MPLLKKRKTGNGDLSPSMRKVSGINRFSPFQLLDLDDDFWTDDFNSPAANVMESEKEYHIEVCAPGFKKQDFNIDVEDGLLTISSEKESESKDEDKNYRSREFSYSAFSRSFRLPENISEDKIKARYENGLLQLTVPKNETNVSKPKKKISIS